MLIRGDKNPNTKGLLDALSAFKNVKKWGELQAQLQQSEVGTIWVAGPENQAAYPDLKELALALDGSAKRVIWWTAPSFTGKRFKAYMANTCQGWRLKSPVLLSITKEWHKKLTSERVFVPEALSLSESVAVFKNRS